jgi:hypothetical protein
VAGIRTIAAERGKEFRVIGISLSETGLADYVRANNFVFPVYTNAAEPDGRKLTVSATPETLLISREGRVENSWIGAYGGNIKTQIESALAVHLPEIPQLDVPRK